MQFLFKRWAIMAPRKLIFIALYEFDFSGKIMGWFLIAFSVIYIQSSAFHRWAAGSNLENPIISNIIQIYGDIWIHASCTEQHENQNMEFKIGLLIFIFQPIDTCTFTFTWINLKFRLINLKVRLIKFWHYQIIPKDQRTLIILPTIIYYFME